MEVYLAPHAQAKLERMVVETGRPVDQLIEEALAEYDPDLKATRKMLDSRYDDIESGRVKLILGEDVAANSAKRVPPHVVHSLPHERI